MPPSVKGPMVLVPVETAVPVVFVLLKYSAEIWVAGFVAVPLTV